MVVDSGAIDVGPIRVALASLSVTEPEEFFDLTVVTKDEPV